MNSFKRLPQDKAWIFRLEKITRWMLIEDGVFNNAAYTLGNLVPIDQSDQLSWFPWKHWSQDNLYPSSRAVIVVSPAVHWIKVSLAIWEWKSSFNLSLDGLNLNPKIGMRSLVWWGSSILHNKLHSDIFFYTITSLKWRKALPSSNNFCDSQ